MKLAQLTKKQRDAAFRQQAQDPAKGAIITTNETGSGSVSNPSSDLAAHKSSGDHDGRYYTEAEIDALLAAATGYYEPLTNGDADSPEILFYNGDVIMVEVS